MHVFNLNSIKACKKVLKQADLTIELAKLYPQDLESKW